MTATSSSKSRLEKIPFDYYDFFNLNWSLGMQRAEMAVDMKKMGLNATSFIFETLAKENLQQMKIIQSVDNDIYY